MDNRLMFRILFNYCLLLIALLFIFHLIKNKKYTYAEKKKKKEEEIKKIRMKLISRMKSFLNMPW